MTAVDVIEAVAMKLAAHDIRRLINLNLPNKELGYSLSRQAAVATTVTAVPPTSNGAPIRSTLCKRKPSRAF